MTGAEWSDPVEGVLFFQEVWYLLHAGFEKARSRVDERWLMAAGKWVCEPGCEMSSNPMSDARSKKGVEMRISSWPKDLRGSVVGECRLKSPIMIDGRGELKKIWLGWRRARFQGVL